MMEYSCTGESISVKMVVHLSGDQHPIKFTSDISSNVDHVISQTLCELPSSTTMLKPEDYLLKVLGRAEFLQSDTCLRDYEYVHDCIKLERDVELCLLHVDDASRPLLRTKEDDVVEVNISIDDLLSREPSDALTHATVSVLLDTIHCEMERLLKNPSPTQPKGLIQSIKGITESIVLSIQLPFSLLLSSLQLQRHLLQYLQYHA